MNILGISSPAGSHDTAAALVCDGALIAAAEEERFSRQKHDGKLPIASIDFCLRHAGLTMREVDVFAISERPFRTGRNSPHADSDYKLLHRLHREGAVRRRTLVHKRLLDAYLQLDLPWNLDFGCARHMTTALQSLKQHYGRLPLVRFFDHHRCHAAAAFFTSGLKRATVITLDGRGESYATVVWKGEGTTFQRLSSEPFTNSLGQFYEHCTEYLGLGEFGQGKLMGLAAYGNAERFAAISAAMLDCAGAELYRWQQSPSLELTGFPPREQQCITNPPYPDFAAACQSRLEQAITRVVSHALVSAGIPDLCLAGGVCLNCSANGTLLRSGVAASIWVPPPGGDAGLSLGAAMLAAAEHNELKPQRLANAYLGPAYSDKVCEAVLRTEPRVRYHWSPDIATEIAQELANEKVVGWFQGRMEIGPRALGNRSILADPRTVAMRDRVNRVKRRELWRPLAPVTLAERAAEYFAPDAPSPFMLFAMQVCSAKRQQIPAVVHVDGSARPQTVTADQNPRLYSLISAFERITAIPVLLNTSFNTAGEPIVCTPQDAIRTFLDSELDCLAVENFIVRRANHS